LLFGNLPTKTPKRHTNFAILREKNISPFGDFFPQKICFMAAKWSEKQHLSNFIKLEKNQLADDEGFFQALALQGLG
jgi:hypothetical protein